MKIVILIVFTLITFHGVSQTYDSLYFKLKEEKINFKDEFGRKQGKWYNYEIRLCNNDSSILSLNPYHIFISITSKGEYINDRKTGTWRYITDDYRPCDEGEQQITIRLKKIEYYKNDTITIYAYKPCWEETIYGYEYRCWVDTAYTIITNRDSSFFKSEIYDRDGKICGTCFKKESSDTTICRLLGGKKIDATRKEIIYTDIKNAFEFTECGCRCWY